jgi:hypothetical protein
MDKLLASIYFDASHPAGYGTAKALWIAAKKKYTLVNVKKWLSSQDAYTLHKPRRLKFTRSRYYVPSMNNLFQGDLCDMRSLVKFNPNVTFILTVIDVFSKRAWAIPLKNKSADTVITALKIVFKDSKPIYFQTDRGKEFVAGKVQQFLKEQSVQYYTTNNPDIKCSVVERLNRSLKTKMWKYFAYAGTYKYTDVLPALVDSYNNTVHSAIGMSPNSVNKNNEKQVYQYLYSGNGRYKVPKPNVKAQFKIGDKIRITREKATFEKGYESNWSREVFVISKVLQRKPMRYQIKDLHGETILGTFYEAELQHVTISKKTFFQIDKILDSKGKGNSLKHLVKWKGYPDKFNSWISASQLKK